jgi:hypothetical protein
MTTASDSSKYFAGWLLAFFLTVIGAHLWVVWLYGSALPFWDQWDEALKLFKPWVEGHLTWADITAPFNGHRIIPTYLLDMGLILLNGRWDPILQMTVNAFIHAAYACGLAFSLWHFGGRRNGWFVCGLLLPFFAFPYAGESAVWGFDSMWYFPYVFGLVAIVGVGFYRAGSWPWWIGLAAALLGLFTLSLGPVTPVAIGGLMVLRTIKNRKFGRGNLISLGACLALVGVGAVLNVSGQGDTSLQAHSFAEFAKALIRQLDWPFYNLPEMAFVIVLPLILLLFFYLRPSFQALRMAELLLTLALWSMLASALVAFGRANYGEIIPSSRYTEIFSVLLIASLFATILLGEQWQQNRFLSWTGRLLPLVFAGVIFWGIARMSDIVVDNLLVPTRIMNLIAEERVAAFLATGSDSVLLERPTIRPDPKVALEVLKNPKLQRMLPASCFPAASAPAVGRLATASRWLLRQSITITVMGLVLFVGLCGFGLARGTIRLAVGKPEGILALLAGLTALGFVWSKQSLQRDSVEYGLQLQLAESFKSAGALDRAAFHAHKAEELKPVK